jgi:hypothetical protein
LPARVPSLHFSFYPAFRQERAARTQLLRIQPPGAIASN